jgi:hypothetical protein
MIVDLRTDARAVAPPLPNIPELQESALLTWRGRMINEHTSAEVFEGLARQLAAARLEPQLVAECASFAREERRHGVLCGAVVEALGGHARFERPDTDEFPEHEDVPRLEAALRNLVSISCMSETVAVSLIGAERLEMPRGPLRQLLTEIYADEVGHARFGWRLAGRLATTLDAPGRVRMAAYLRVAFAHLEEHECAHLNPLATPPEEGAALGLCNGMAARALFYATVTDVVVPALEGLGLPAGRAWETRALDIASGAA